MRDEAERAMKYAVMMEGLGSVTVESRTRDIQAAVKNTSTSIRATVLQIDLHCVHILSYIYLVGLLVSEGVGSSQSEAAEWLIRYPLRIQLVKF